MVASTATRLLTARTFDHVRRIANLGSLQAVSEDESLRNGVCCYRGHLTHALSAEKKGLPYQSVSDVLEAAVSTAA